jgi:hypothetical protein
MRSFAREASFSSKQSEMLLSFAQLLLKATAGKPKTWVNATHFTACRHHLKIY